MKPTDKNRVKRIIAKLSTNINITCIRLDDYNGVYCVAGTNGAGEITGFTINEETFELLKSLYPVNTKQPPFDLPLTYFTILFNQWDRARKIKRVVN